MKITALFLGALLVPGVVLGQGPSSGRAAENSWTSSWPAREEMTSFETRLEDAVARVSMPHAGILLGRSRSSRGYRLPGYGIVFVLTPRALPGGDSVFVVRRPHGYPGAAVRVERHVDREASGWEQERVEELERRVLVLQHTAEAHRRAAEEDRDRLVHDIRVRLEVEESDDDEAVVSEPHDVSIAPGTGPAPPPDAVFVARGPGESGTPPWKFWFEAETGEDERTPDGVVGDVKSALIDLLDSRDEAVPGLAPEEFVTVAIDFVPGGFFASHGRPSRTLIVRVRQKDLAARASGDLGSEALRSRVEVIEY